MPGTTVFQELFYFFQHFFNTHIYWDLWDSRMNYDEHKQDTSLKDHPVSLYIVKYLLFDICFTYV